MGVRTACDCGGREDHAQRKEGGIVCVEQAYLPEQSVALLERPYPAALRVPHQAWAA